MRTGERCGALLAVWSRGWFRLLRVTIRAWVGIAYVLPVVAEVVNMVRLEARARRAGWDPEPVASHDVRIGAEWISRPGDRRKECLSSGRRL